MQKFIQEFIHSDWNTISKVFILFLIYVLYKERKIILNMFKFKVSNTRGIESVKYHSLFTYLRDWRKYKIGLISSSSKIWDDTDFTEKEIEKRIWCTKRTLDVKLTWFETQINKFTEKAVKAVNNKDLDFKKETLKFKFWDNFINKSIINYEALIKNSGVNTLFIDKFHEKHREAAEILKYNIKSSLENAPFDDYLEYIYSILNFWENAFISTFSDIGAVCKMNSELSVALEKWDIPTFVFATKISVDSIEVSSIED